MATADGPFRPAEFPLFPPGLGGRKGSRPCLLVHFARASGMYRSFQSQPWAGGHVGSPGSAEFWFSFPPFPHLLRIHCEWVWGTWAERRDKEARGVGVAGGAEVKCNPDKAKH